MKYIEKSKTSTYKPEETIRIDDIQSLSELKRFACPKVMHLNAWYKQCNGCKSVDICRTGMRANELINTAEKSEESTQETKMKAKPSPAQAKTAVKRAGRSQKEISEEALAKYIQALQQEDPVGWLVEHGYNANRAAAYDSLIRWRRHHKDKLPEALSRKKLNLHDPETSKYRRGTEKYLEALRTEDPAGYPVNMGGYSSRTSACSALQKWRRVNLDKLPEELKHAPIWNVWQPKGTAMGINTVIPNDPRPVKLAMLIQEIFEGRTDEEAKIELAKRNTSISGHSLATKIWQWYTRHPEVTEKYKDQMIRISKYFNVRPQSNLMLGEWLKQQDERAIAEDIHADKKTEDAKMANNDEIGLDELLTIIEDEQDRVEPMNKNEFTMQEATVKPENPGMLNWFMAKEKQIGDKIRKIDEQIKKLENERSEYYKQLESVRAVQKMMQEE